MHISAKTGRLLKYILLFIFALILIIAISLAVYLKSPSFIQKVEFIVQGLIERPVDIGSISLVSGNKIIIKDFSVKKGEQGDISIDIPRLEIRASLSGLYNRTINNIKLENPRITLKISKERKVKSDSAKVTLPYSLKKGVVTEGEVYLILDSSRAVRISSVNISIEEADDKKAAIRGRALLNDLNSAISLEAVIDTGDFNIKDANIDISETALQSLIKQKLMPTPDNVEIEGLVSFNIHLEDKDDKLGWQSEMFVKNFSLGSDSLNISTGGPLQLAAEGSYDSNQGIVEILLMQAHIPGLKPWSLKGMIENVHSGSPDFNFEITVDEVPFVEVKKMISGPAVAVLDEITGDSVGTANLSVGGNIESPRVNGILHLHGNEFKKGNTAISSLLMKIPFEYRDRSITVNNASVKANEVFNLNNNVTYHLNDLELQIPDIKYAGHEVRAGISKLAIGKAAIHVNGKKYYEDKDISITLEADGELDKKIIRVRGSSIHTDFFDSVAARSSIDLKGPVVMDAALEFNHIDADKVSQKFFYDFLSSKGIKVNGQGKLNVAFTATVPEQGATRISGSSYLGLADAGFSTADDSIVCEGMELKISERFDFSLPFNNINFKVTSEATGFDLLAGRFYGSFQDKSLIINLDGKYTKSGDSLHLSESSMGLSGIGTLLVSGDIFNISESPLLNVGSRLKDISNSAVYDFFVRETFQEQAPFLSQLQVNGTTSANLFIKGTSDRFTARGNIGVTGMDIAGGNEITFAGINISLPLDISYPEAAHGGGEDQFGFVKIENVFVKELNFTDIEFFPAVRQNDLVFKEDIALPVLGGDIIFKNIAYRNLLHPERDLGLSMEIHNIDLSEASALMKLPKFTGSLSGIIPKASFTGNMLRTEGEIVLRLFGGEMTISELSIDNVFSPIASMKSTVEFEGIDLDKLTGTFDFGHISGIFKGRIEDLIIVNGQAESFRASVATVRKKGVDQKINVEALKKISILGTGSSASILDMGIYRLFKEYRYKKMGFNASLRNDKLILVGVESRGDVGYLVVGGVLPPKVDVFTYNQNISFREMVKRLKRIGRAEN